MYYIQGIYIVYICTHRLIFGFGGGPTGQPPLDPNGKALNQPKPHPSNKIASEMPIPHSLGKYFQHHEIQKYCISTNFRILSEHCQLYKGPNNV